MDVNARFEKMLRDNHIDPNVKVLRRVRKFYPSRLLVVEDDEDAISLYRDAHNMVGTTTKQHMKTQCGLNLQRPLVNVDGQPVSTLVTALDEKGRLKVVKLLRSGGVPVGSSALPGGREAASVRAICMGPSKPDGLAIMEAEVITVTLTEDHAGRIHGPGTYAAIVMQRYIGTVDECLVGKLEHVLAEQGERIERAVEYIHKLGLVHMDIKGGNILVDMNGQWALADFGAAVKAGEAITEVTQLYAPQPNLVGKPALPQYDWHMLAVTLAAGLYLGTWRERLVESDAKHGVYAPLQKLEAAVRTASHPALVELFGRILGKATVSMSSTVGAAAGVQVEGTTEA